MIEKLKQNYQLSRLITRLLFLTAFVFCNYQTLAFATSTVYSEIGLGVAQLGYGTFIFTVVLCGVILGLIVSFIIPIFVNLILNWSHFYTVPRAEYSLLLLLYVALQLAICGVLGIVNYFTPLFLVWGDFLFSFISITVAFILFYRKTSNMYFNDVTKPSYFRLTLIVYSACVLLGVVL